jgi:TolB protein
MKNHTITIKHFFVVFSLLTAGSWAHAQNPTVNVQAEVHGGLGMERPTLVSMTGFTGEAAQVLQFDLYVQGFAFTNADAAEYELSGSNEGGSLRGQAVNRINKAIEVSKAYTGSSLRTQAHQFADDFVRAIGRIGIARTQIAFKGESGVKSDIYMCDFDGHNVQPITRDGAIVAAPCWVPGRLAMYYVSYVRHYPDIYYQNVAAGARKVFAQYGGSNLSPAVSPDGREVAMILSKDGWVDLYVANSDGSNLRRLTHSPQDESSPCWSPDGKSICFASKDKEYRGLSIISAAGGKPRRISTAGVSSPTEPDWSPDGKLIAFTSQTRGGFNICVVPATGGEATVLAEGEDPSWAPNSRTLVCARRAGGKGDYVLSLLDVQTKQVKTVPRTYSGISSQSQPSWAKPSKE